MAKRGEVSKKRLMRLLQRGPLSLTQDRELLLLIGTYLENKNDADLIEKTCEAYQQPFSVLKPLMLAGVQRDYADICPSQLTWLTDWLKVTKENEAPGIFHALAAICVSSIMMGRRCWVNMGNFRLYPPMSCILVGPSGTRKTTAINIASKLLYMYPDKDDIAILREKVTPESLITALKGEEDGDSIGILVAPELSVTLGKQSYLTGMIPVLTRLMDQDSVELTTLARGTLRVDNVGFSMLGGTTENWITSAMSEDVVSGGFTSRILFGVIDRTTRVIFRATRTTLTEIELLGTLLCERIHEIEGELDFDLASEEYLKNWYHGHTMQVQGENLVSGYQHRKLSHIIRLGMIFAIMEGDKKIKISHVSAAMELLEYLEPPAFELFRRLSAPEVTADAEKVATIMRKEKNLHRSRIFRGLQDSLPADRIRAALVLLVEVGKIKPVGQGDRYEWQGEQDIQ